VSCFLAILLVGAFACSNQDAVGTTQGPARSGQSIVEVRDSSAGAATTDARSCGTLPTVNRARLLGAPDRSRLLVGGKIRGSNTSATNDFVDLFTIGAAPAEGQWLDVTFSNATPYRYVKYYAPPESYGVLAELELYQGAERLQGKAFGTAGSRGNSGNTFDKALDANPMTYFEAPLANDNYVGLDLESDPSGPCHLDEAPTHDRAPAPVAAPADVGRSRRAQSSVHIGNSLTDTIVDHLDVAARAGGIQLDFHRYTIPGAGTDWLWAHPTGGFGETDIQQSLRSRGFDHISLQPFPNGPCTPSGAGSESDFVNRFYALAKATNPQVVLWIYQQWPSPVDWKDCFSAGSPWVQAPWTPPLANPPTWEDAVNNQLAFQEAVRAAVAALNPDHKAIYIVPAGLSLRDLKRQVEAGQVPGMAEFFTSIFDQNGTDLHLTEPGRYFVTLVFYACMFQKSPQGIEYAGTGVSAVQAAKLQEIAWKTVSTYAPSGVSR
jgi:hypothetical protein